MLRAIEQNYSEGTGGRPFCTLLLHCPEEK